MASLGYRFPIGVYCLLPSAYHSLPMRLLVPLIVLAVLLAGCGYKTPLKLPKPGEKATAVKPPQGENVKKPAGEP